MYKYRFSIFTATYNRCNLLYGRYKELLNQDFKDFEWVIVSDGSVDDTAKVIESFIKENKIPIQFINKENGGKHTAWKVATDVFQGRYIICADDDYEILPSMLSVFNKYWSDLEKDSQYEEFWEIRARCSRENSSLIGGVLPIPFFDSDYNEINYVYKNHCEMVGCRKVEVLRNEAAVPDNFIFQDKVSNYQEGLRWSQAARKYKTRFVPDIVRIYLTTENSLTNPSKNRSARHVYNTLVSSYFALKEQRDLMYKYDKKKYFFNIAILIYNSFYVKEKIYCKLEKHIDKIVYIMLYLPILVAWKIRK